MRSNVGGVVVGSIQRVLKKVWGCRKSMLLTIVGAALKNSRKMMLMTLPWIIMLYKLSSKVVLGIHGEMKKKHDALRWLPGLIGMEKIYISKER